MSDNKQKDFHNTQETLYAIKRHVYPLSILLVAISSFYTAFLGASYIFLYLGVFCLLLALVDVLLSPYRNVAEAFHTFTYFFLIAIFCTHFGRVIFYALNEIQPISTLIEGFVWVPVVYMATVVFYPQRRGLIYAWVIFFTTLLIGSVQIFLASPNPSIIRAFGDFYLASVGFLLFLYVFVYMHRVFYEARAYAEIQGRLAESDEFTGLPNRRYLQAYLHNLTHKAKWGEAKFSLALCAPNYKTKPKLSYSQEFIDSSLKTLAEILNESLNGGTLGRWSAESLLIIWPDYSLEQAVSEGEYLIRAFQEHSVSNQDSLEAILGVASFLPNDDMVSLIKRAGKALDKAKESGNSGVETTQGPFGLRVTE